MRSTLAFLLALITLHATAQNVRLLQGTLEVAPGTELTLVGPLAWEIASGALLINDGVIDLGTAGSLVEASGSPVVGSGTEQAVLLPGTELNGLSIAGLGLGVQGESITDTVIIERGHGPRTGPAGEASIARWFQVDGTGWPAEGAVLLTYDATELNGLDPALLKVHRALSNTGPWAMPGATEFVNSTTLRAQTNATTGFYTAFDLDLSVSSPALPATDQLFIRPTLVEDHLWVSSDDPDVSWIELLDVHGRSLGRQAITPLGTTRIDVATLAAGIYWVKAGGSSQTRKFVKP
ncbi:MAG: T9SS type A sorting domain-containing protein [Flavobacteriales bacterium]|nr:T9SS type A sorting domain-containing protein [Flavobacteriales bacterium]